MWMAAQFSPQIVGKHTTIVAIHDTSKIRKWLSFILL
jgi:hypothetical protein